MGNRNQGSGLIQCIDGQARSRKCRWSRGWSGMVGRPRPAAAVSQQSAGGGVAVTFASSLHSPSSSLDLQLNNISPRLTQKALWRAVVPAGSDDNHPRHPVEGISTLNFYIQFANVDFLSRFVEARHQSQKFRLNTISTDGKKIIIFR